MLEDNMPERLEALVREGIFTREQALAVLNAIPAPLALKLGELRGLMKAFYDSYLDCIANNKTEILLSQIVEMAHLISKLQKDGNDVIDTLPDQLKEQLLKIIHNKSCKESE